MTDRDNTFVVGRIVTRGATSKESKNVVTRGDIMKDGPYTVYDRAKHSEFNHVNSEVTLSAPTLYTLIQALSVYILVQLIDNILNMLKSFLDNSHCIHLLR